MVGVAVATLHSTYELNGRQFVHTYSDVGCYVVRDGVAYSDAIDPAEYGRTYTEGEQMPKED